jgi:hypothetical protein
MGGLVSNEGFGFKRLCTHAARCAVIGSHMPASTSGL